MSYKKMKDLDVKLENNILWLTLDNESMSNAITDDMIDSLEEVLSISEFDLNVRVVVLGGKGKCFCAGGDVKAMKDKSGMFSGEPNALRQNYRRGIQRIPRAIEAFSKPIIAMVNGAAVGAGCDLASMCDIRVVSENAKFAETFSKLSLVPGDGGTFFLQRVVGYTKAMEMFLTGDFYSAEDALSMGLANFVVSSSELESQTREVALKISKNAPVALSMTKIALKSGRSSNLNDQLELLATFQGVAQRTQDHFEGIEALLDKRDPSFKGE